MGKVRDRFMAEALAALIISRGVNTPGSDQVAEEAVQYADAMMRARRDDRARRRQEHRA